MSNLCTVASVHFVMQGVPRHETLLCLWQVVPARRTEGSMDGEEVHHHHLEILIYCGVRALRSFSPPISGPRELITVCQLYLHPTTTDELS
jgi:hypothetical protein